MSPPAKSSKVFWVASMMWFWIKGAPSLAPCSGLLMQHSHSITAHTITAVFGQFGKDGFKVDLPVSRRTITSGPVYPIPITSKSSFFPIGFKFRIFDMKRFDKFVVVIDIFDVVQLL